MEYDVKASDPSHCEAEGRYRGYVVKVFGRTDINTGRWRMEVYFLKLGEYGQAPIAMHKLGTTTVSAGSSAEVFVLGFAMAEAEIDSYFSARPTLAPGSGCAICDGSPGAGPAPARSIMGSPGSTPLSKPSAVSGR